MRKLGEPVRALEVFIGGHDLLTNSGHLIHAPHVPLPRVPIGNDLLGQLRADFGDADDE